MTALALAPDTRIGYEHAAAAGVDRAIRVSTAIAVLAVAGVAAYVSYWHAYAVVCAHGETGVTARLEPATIDGLVYASSMVNLYAARHRLPVPALARWLLALGIIATLPPTWPRDGPTDQSARSSQPGRRSAWWAATSCWSGSSGPQPRETWAAGQPRTTGRRRTATVPASGSLLFRGLMPDRGTLPGWILASRPAMRTACFACAGWRARAEQAGWNAADHADQAADQPSGSRGPVTAASQGGDINAAAVAAYRTSVQAGQPLSERKLAGQFGKTSRRWARNRMAEAQPTPAPAWRPQRVGAAGAETPPADDFGGVSARRPIPRGQ